MLAPIAMIASVEWPGFGRYLYIPWGFCVIALAEVSTRIVDSRPGQARTLAVAAAGWLLLATGLHVAVTFAYRDLDAFTRATWAASPDARYSWASMGRIHAEAGEHALAVPLLRGALDAQPDDSGTRRNLAWSLVHAARFEDVEQVADPRSHAVRDEDRAELWHALGAARLEGDVDGAADAFVSCLALQGYDGTCVASLARISAGHPAAPSLRRALAQRADEMSPDDPAAEPLTRLLTAWQAAP
jgi:tetratricopeptide (TPR) repeat protein